jgi:hypothetical protein
VATTEDLQDQNPEAKVCSGDLTLVTERGILPRKRTRGHGKITNTGSGTEARAGARQFMAAGESHEQENDTRRTGALGDLGLERQQKSSGNQDPQARGTKRGKNRASRW